MADLIERDAVLREAEKAYNYEDARGKLAFAIHAIKNYPAVNRWIPVSERLPKKTGYYLVCDSTLVADGMRGRQDVSKYVIGRHGGHWYGAIRRECITHWMPLPEPPESEVQE